MILLGFAACGAAPAEPVRYLQRQAAGLPLHVVDVDLNDPRVVVSPALAERGVGTVEAFSHFVARLRPAAAINGTFFSKTTLRPVGDIVADGKLLHFGGMGTAFAFSRHGVDVIRLPKSRRVDWSEHRAALAGGPLLVWDGFAKPLPGGEGFGDPHVFARSAPRAGLGVTKDSHLLLVATVRGSSLAALAKALRELGAVYAINLDGGSSVGLYCEGRMIRGAGRSLTNVLAVYLRPEPVRDKPLRAPEGLDWRAGYRPRPVLSFSARGTRISAQLPRRWQGEVEVRVSAAGGMPEGWTVRVRIDQKIAAVVGSLPADVTLDLSGLDPKADHEIRMSAITDRGERAAEGARIFRLGGPRQR